MEVLKTIFQPTQSYLGVDLSRAQLLMTEERLDIAAIHAALQHQRRHRMPERHRRHLLVEAGESPIVGEDLAHARLRQLRPRIVEK